MSPAVAMGALWDCCMQVRLGRCGIPALRAIVDRYVMDEYDVAKVRALYRAHKELVDMDAQCTVQDDITKQVRLGRCGIPALRAIFARS